MPDVHTEHCGIHHGCKYGDDDCTVETGEAKQSFPCEDCESLGICLDQEKEAMSKPTLAEAAQVLVDDSLYWGGYFHGAGGV